MGKAFFQPKCPVNGEGERGKKRNRGFETGKRAFYKPLKGSLFLEETVFSGKKFRKIKVPFLVKIRKK